MVMIAARHAGSSRPLPGVLKSLRVVEGLAVEPGQPLPSGGILHVHRREAKIPIVVGDEELIDEVLHIVVRWHELTDAGPRRGVDLKRSYLYDLR